MGTVDGARESLEEIEIQQTVMRAAGRLDSGGATPEIPEQGAVNALSEAEGYLFTLHEGQEFVHEGTFHIQ